MFSEDGPCSDWLHALISCVLLIADIVQLYKFIVYLDLWIFINILYSLICANFFQMIYFSALVVFIEFLYCLYTVL